MSIERSTFNARLVLTLALGIVYCGAMIWAIMHDKLDIQSFIAGIGPSFGVVLKSWFDAET